MTNAIFATHGRRTRFYLLKAGARFVLNQQLCIKLHINGCDEYFAAISSGEIEVGKVKKIVAATFVEQVNLATVMG